MALLCSSPPPVDDVAAGAIQDGAQIVERAVDVDVRDVDMPVLVRPQWLDKARTLFGRLARKIAQPTGIAQYPENARGAHRHHIRIDHHIGQAAIAFYWIALLKIQDRLLFPVGKPEITGSPAVVPVGLAAALGPIVILARAQFQPMQQALDGEAGFLHPLTNEVHDRIADIRLHPATVQSSPRSFFNAMCSAISETANPLRLFLSFQLKQNTRSNTMIDPAGSAEGIAKRDNETSLASSKPADRGLKLQRHGSPHPINRISETDMLVEKCAGCRHHSRKGSEKSNR